MPDPFELRKHYHYLRVVDVCDALDGIGYFNIGLVSPEIRPLWLGMRFWGVAFTVRCVPANRPMWTLDSTADIVNAHGVWFDKMGRGAWGFNDQLRPGHVVVTDTGGAIRRPVGLGKQPRRNESRSCWHHHVRRMPRHRRDRAAEDADLRPPPRPHHHSRTHRDHRDAKPHRLRRRASRPGDMVGCDDDGVVVVPQEVAATVATHAKAILLADMKARRSYYEALGIQPDPSVDHAAIARYYNSLGPV